MELRVEIVKLGPVEKHPNADSLAITKVFDYPVIDVFDKKLGRYLPFDTLRGLADNEGFPPLAPTLYRGPWEPGLKSLAEGVTQLMPPIDAHMREGFVVRPVEERMGHCGRVIFKCINPAYLLRKGGTEGK